MDEEFVIILALYKLVFGFMFTLSVKETMYSYSGEMCSLVMVMDWDSLNAYGFVRVDCLACFFCAAGIQPGP